jgi:mediator of replication checkpoint protein 1
VPDSQEQSSEATATETVHPDAPTVPNPLKRKALAEFNDKENVAPSMAHRRSAPKADAKRPKTLAEIKESLSTLLDEPLVPDSQMSDSDDDDRDRESRATHHESSISALCIARSSVVNRLSFTAVSTNDTTSSGPLAFHGPISDSLSGFKVPSLLRRATTNLSTASNSSSGTTTPTSETAVRMGGSKKANIHYQAREAERRKIVDAAERKRKEGLKKIVVRKGEMSALGVLGRQGSGFE